jgi:hypothetical protein
MKRILLFSLGTLLFMIAPTYGQTTKDVTIAAGQLFAVLTYQEKGSVQNLRIKGIMDARDFKTIRDDLPSLKSLNLKETVIASYYDSARQENGTHRVNLDMEMGAFTTIIITNDSLDGYLYHRNQVPVFSFCNKDELQNVELSDSVTSIDDKAFLNCYKLQTLIIPMSVTSFGSEVFSNCKTLTKLYIKSSVPANLAEHQDVFMGFNRKQCTLYVPAGSKHLYENASEWKDFKAIIEQ